MSWLCNGWAGMSCVETAYGTKENCHRMCSLKDYLFDKNSNLEDHLSNKGYNENSYIYTKKSISIICILFCIQAPPPSPTV